MGKIDTYYKQFESCRQKEEPACTNTCPFHLNVLDFQENLVKHNYNRAYREYKNAVCFPDIVAALCPEYCNKACPRKDFDGAVQLNLLEKACVEKAQRKDPIAYNLPSKEGKIGIIGAGISGLACALKLAEKKYEVVVFEKDNIIGGQLNGLSDSDVFMRDIERQFSKVNYELHLNAEIKTLDELAGYHFNALYVATGKGGEDFGIEESEGSYCCMVDDSALFAGGALVGKDVVQSIAQGIDIAWAIEVFLKTAKLEYPRTRPLSLVVPNSNNFVSSPKVELSFPNETFTDEEVSKEASRCIRCQCDACQTDCDLVAFYKNKNKWPMAIKEDIAMTVVSTESMIHKTPAIRIINTCTHCGLFEESCPAGIDMNNMILEAKKLLHKQGKMPPAFHGFWLDDMAHANSHLAKICMNACNENTSEYAFFPGCHLGADNPLYVEESYKWLQNNFKRMGLLLRCCGVPANWSGNEEIHTEQIESMKEDWELLGKPTLVTACPSCTKHINEFLPDIKTVSIYELMKENDAWPKLVISGEVQSQEFSVFDPCSARKDEPIKAAVREGLKEVNLVDLPNGANHGCCGYGGNVEIANPNFAKFVANKRSELSDNPYITYCINCKDVFLREGKSALHAFDLLFGINSAENKDNSLTQQRKNRMELKKNILREYLGEEMEECEKQHSFEIEIPFDLREKMDSIKLVDDDIMQVIETSNKLKRRTFDKEKDEYICYARLNYITCWVNYKIENNVYNITNVYTHRMDIELEEVWNGRKINTDM